MPTKKKRSSGRPAEIDPQKLLDIAEALFADRGCAATTHRELARRARCNLAMISYHFGSKEGLYKATLARCFGRVRAAFDCNEDNTEECVRKDWPELATTDERRFAAIIFKVGKILILDEHMHKIYSREMLAGGRQAVALLSNSETGVMSPLRAFLEGMAAEGKFRKGIDWRLGLITIMGPLVYSCLNGPVIRDVYGFGKTDEKYIRQLCLHLTRTMFEGWKA